MQIRIIINLGSILARTLFLYLPVDVHKTACFEWSRINANIWKQYPDICFCSSVNDFASLLLNEWTVGIQSAKAGGEKWLQLSDEEKAPYISEAADRKAKYETAMATYKNGSAKQAKGVQNWQRWWLKEVC
jgi:hypothetical protein